MSPESPGIPFFSEHVASLPGSKGPRLPSQRPRRRRQLRLKCKWDTETPTPKKEGGKKNPNNGIISLKCWMNIYGAHTAEPARALLIIPTLVPQLRADSSGGFGILKLFSGTFTRANPRVSVPMLPQVFLGLLIAAFRGRQHPGVGTV